MEILNTRLSPAMVECLPEWYPGWRALNRLKEEWVAKDRSKNGVHIAESLTDDQGCQLDCPDNRDPPIEQGSRDFTPDCVGTAGLQPVAESCQASLSLVVFGVGIGRPWC
jgi:hypothetical protein